MWKVEFAQINAPHFPHLVNQLEFLADLVEDVAEGVYKELPYSALAAAVFAITYAHKKTHPILAHVPIMGHADHSTVARAVLILPYNSLAPYPSHPVLDCDTITSQL